MNTSAQRKKKKIYRLFCKRYLKIIILMKLRIKKKSLVFSFLYSTAVAKCMQNNIASSCLFFFNRVMCCAALQGLEAAALHARVSVRL